MTSAINNEKPNHGDYYQTIPLYPRQQTAINTNPQLFLTDFFPCRKEILSPPKESWVKDWNVKVLVPFTVLISSSE